MLCPSCRAGIPDTSKFCPSCGHRLDPSNAETALGDGATRLAADDPKRTPSNAPARTSSPTGWLSSSGSIDHGRFAPGTVLDNRYRVIGLLGRGGMGEVYRADDLRLGQPVALKFLPETLGRDPVRLAQFHNEVRTARQVSHPNVCRVYDIGEIGDQLFLTMEYVDGEDLSSLLRRIGRLPEDKALEIARQICAGLAAAHERGVLHRDLKPANIMLDGAGRVRIMDFSLAAVGEVADVRAGTPAYMAPEQLQGREVTVRSDIYALGLVLYELFTGRRVFDVKTLAELVEQHQSGTITSPTDLVKTLDPAVEGAILRCLNPDPAKRPSSALAVSGALPGGDPLAAALAAGETPSPEMVAAAGGEAATLTAAQGVSLATLLCILFVGFAWLTDRTALIARVPLDKPRPVLIDRAAELRQKLGYTVPAADAASGLEYDDAYLNWAARHDAGRTNWAQLAKGRPAAVRFWYRTSPSLMLPYRSDGSVSLRDPPPLTRGMVRIDLDMQGRLLWFEAVPSPKQEMTGRMIDWEPLFQAAGLDRSRFSEVPPTLLPRAYADERKAWEGTLAEAPGMKFQIEGAGFQGRPTMFALLGEWDLAEGQQTSRPSPIVRFIGVLIITALPIGAALLARRNLRMGRGDRRGAFRTWAFAFGALVVAGAISPSHVSGLEEIDRMFATIGRFLFWTGVLYVTYLALEPHVRRTWPNVLIAWSRLVSGRIRDPLVGRDLVAGTIGGISFSLVTPLFALAPTIFGWPQPQLDETALGALLGTRDLLAFIAAQLFNALQNGMIVMLILSLIRQALAKLAGMAPGGLGRLLGSDLPMFVVSIVLFVIVIKRNSIDPVYPWLDVCAAVLLLVVLLIVAFRFGLFALAWAFLVNSLVGDMAQTLDASKPYAGAAWFVGAIVIALALLGVWMARAGEPMFGKASAA